MIQPGSPEKKPPAPLATISAYKPPWWAKRPLFQTLFAQLGIRTWGRNEMLERARGEIIRLDDGVSLEGFYSAQLSAEARGLVILLSGWEGHAGSPYMVRTGRTLFRAGFDVFRLNYPDHGDTHDLNEELFHFAMKEKILEAIGKIVGAIRTRPVYLVGFSMGGHFTLHAGCRGIPGVRLGVAVSPALDLAKAIEALELHPFLHSYFLKVWRTSLERKARLYPHRYNYAEVEKAATLGQVAEKVLVGSKKKVSLQEACAPYSLDAEKLRELKLPVHLVAALDDPMVGKIDYGELVSIPNLTLHVERHGGHVAFLTSLFGDAWYERLIVSLIEQNTRVDELVDEEPPPESYVPTRMRELPPGAFD